MTSTQSPSATKTSVLRKKLPVFWAALVVNAVFDALLAIGVLGVGIASGYEGRLVFNTSRLGDAASFLFGGFGQLFVLLIILAILGAVAKGLLWLKDNKHDNWLFVAIVGVLALAILTDVSLPGGFNIAPLLVFTVFVTVQSWITALIATRQRADH